MSFKCNSNKADCRDRCDRIPKVLEFLRIINDENRLRIICVLTNTKGLGVNEIAESLGIAQNLLSHHLIKMLELGILKRSKNGLRVYYQLVQEVLNDYQTDLGILLNQDFQQ